MPILLLLIGIFLAGLGLSKFFPSLENYITEGNYKRHFTMLVVIIFALFLGFVAIGVFAVEGILKILQAN